MSDKSLVERLNEWADKRLAGASSPDLRALLREAAACIKELERENKATGEMLTLQTNIDVARIKELIGERTIGVTRIAALEEALHVARRHLSQDHACGSQRRGSHAKVWAFEIEEPDTASSVRSVARDESIPRCGNCGNTFAGPGKCECPTASESRKMRDIDTSVDNANKSGT